MSNLKDLAARFARELAGYHFAVTVVLEDAAGTETITHAPAVALPGTIRDVRPALARIMAGAHPGAVAEVTLPATADGGAVLAAPGRAFDDRSLTPPPPVGTGTLSTAGDVRAITKGERLAVPTRLLIVTTAGTLAVRTVGTPGEIQPGFAVAAGVQIPLSVLEVGTASTAEVIALF